MEDWPENGGDAQPDDSRKPVGTSTAFCLEAIRNMIFNGELLPGQQIRQAQLADQLELSRIPVREALIMLASVGVVTHTSNVGFAVARFVGEELSEIYLMRRLLEAELLRSLDLSKVDCDRLEEINDHLRSLPSGPEAIWERRNLNRELHFSLFNLSPLTVVCKELVRLWDMSDVYRTFYTFDKYSLQRTITAHDDMITAVRNGDTELLIGTADEHRSRAEKVILERLSPWGLWARNGSDT